MRYTILRIGQAVLVLFAAFTLANLLLMVLPGDGVLARYSSPELGLSPAEIESIRHSYGADRPWWVQYWISLIGFLTGRFGFSVQSGAAVSDLVAAALPGTLVLALVAFLAAALTAVAVAVLATYGRQRWLRAIFDSVPALLVSVPTFWFGIILAQIFSFQLGWVHVVDPGPVESLVLPVATLVLPISAPMAQVLIRSITEVRMQPFVRVALSKGATPSWTLVHSVARSATLPALTVAGLVFGELVGGAVVTETVFGRAGLGQLTSQAVANRDNPVLLAMVVLATLGYVVINLVVDLLYPVVDVRLRRGRAEPIPASRRINDFGGGDLGAGPQNLEETKEVPA